MKTFVTIHAIAQNNKSEILLLQRAATRERAGKWNCITGFIEERESAEDAAVRELKEETNLEGELVKTGEPHWLEHDGARWVIIPSLIRVADVSALRVDEGESQSFRWVAIDDPTINTMSSLLASLKQLGMREQS